MTVIEVLTLLILITNVIALVEISAAKRNNRLTPNKTVKHLKTIS